MASKLTGLKASILPSPFQRTKSCAVWNSTMSARSLPSLNCCSIFWFSTLLKPPSIATVRPGNLRSNSRASGS